MADIDGGGRGPQVIKIVRPTYIMAPTEDEKFRRKKVCGIVSKVLEEELDEKEYNEEDSKEWCISIADKVKARIKEECHFPRYKIIVQSVVGQQKHQDVRIASRCLWDNDHDNHASVDYNNHSLWATCIVFGLYAD